MIKEKEKRERKNETIPLDGKEVMEEHLNKTANSIINEEIDTLSSLAYLMLSPESRDQMGALFSKNEEEDNDDWKAVALEIMRKVDARQREEEKQIFHSPENQKIVKISSAQRSSNDGIHQVVTCIYEEDNRQIEAEMKTAKPHVFSTEFERKMEELMKVETPEMKSERRKKKFLGVARNVAAVVVAVVLLGGVISSGNKNVAASQMKFRIKEWLENAFVVEEGNSVRQDEGILFDVDQIGYIPEGFELVVDELYNTKAYFRFKNDANDHVVLLVYRDSSIAGVDNYDIMQDSDINEAGFEYQYFYKKESKEHFIKWIDKKDMYYVLYGTIEKIDLVNIMDNIIY